MALQESMSWWPAMVHRRLDNRKRTLAIDLKAGVLKDEKKILWRKAKMASSGEIWEKK